MRTLENSLVAVLLCAAFSLRAETISIPNYSFESPVTPFVSASIDSWQQLPDPSSFTSGIFLNAPGNSFIDNCEGNQAAFLIAAPQAGILQDYDSVDYTNTTPTHAFNALFEVGKSYDLTVGITGSTNSPLMNGATLEVALYYRDGASNIISVVTTNVAYDSSAFSAVHFRDFHVSLPTVKATDAWAGQHIGISIFSTVSVALAGGAWDIDNVRLSATGQAVLLNPGFSNGHFGFTLQSTPGEKFEILASSDASLATSNWSSIGTVTNVTGTISFTDTGPILGERFYQAHQLP